MLIIEERYDIRHLLLKIFLPYCLLLFKNHVRGGGGFRPINFILRYWLKGKARTGPEIFRVVLGPCAQLYTCEALEQKLGQTPKSKPKEL